MAMAGTSRPSGRRRPPPASGLQATGAAVTFTRVLFGLKKFVSYFLMPLPFCLGVLIIGLWFLLRRRRTRPRLGRTLVLTGLGLLLFFSQNRVSVWLLRPLEQTYPALPEFHPGDTLPAALQRVRYIIVLGGGNKDEAGVAASNRLSANSLSRLTEAVRLWRMLPDRRLIVSGPGNPGAPTHADVLAEAAVSMGVPAERIIRIDTAHDTEEEAGAVKKLIANAPAALVTSAWHLPRAAALFRQAGVDILPCPADFLALVDPQLRWTDLDFDVDGLERSSLAIRERIGYLWVWLRGKI
ncbi:MAG: hypothetical protein RL324_698 [Verrucomicrobiota bacterium]